MPSNTIPKSTTKNAAEKLILHKHLRESLKGQVIAHRGAPLLAPENTLSGFKTAAKMNAKWVEFDTQPCASGEWCVIHDDTLDRTTTGQGRVIETPYSLLKTLDAGSWFHSHFKGEPIPLLSEVLALLARLKLQPNIEIKFELQNDQQALEHFCDILKNHWPNSLLPPLVSSFNFNTLSMLHKIQPTLPLGMLIERTTANLFSSMNQLEPFSLHCDYEHLPSEFLLSLLSMQGNQHDDRGNHSKDYVSEAQPRDFSLLLYTINDQKQALAYLNQGVTAVFSDIPNLLNLPESGV